MEIIGIDVGFGFTKVTNGRKSLCFKSVLGETTDIQFSTGLGNREIVDNLHVSVDGKGYFIGDFAIAQSSVRQFTLDQERLLEDFLPVLSLTAAGLFAETGITLNVVTGLPVVFLKQDYEKMIKAMSGKHQLVYHWPDGSRESRDVTIHAVQIMPQPLGTVFGVLMDENGRLVNRGMADKKIGVVDIGFRTTDFLVFDRMSYVERSSSTVDMGMSRSFMAISEKLKRESGVQVELYRLYEAVEKGAIQIRGKEYHIANLRDRVFARAAEELAGEIGRLWSDEWDMHGVILTGGGSQALASFLAPKLEIPVLPALEKVSDPRFYNVDGYLRFGKSRWRKTPVPLPSTTASPASEPPVTPSSAAGKS
ncbi:plasmid segregation protein ParM [Desulfobotulus alkaliphilus]|uniref:Plasmid segregation protein ParM n=1 Tax=Desulfobotulus alkaliphilus TaxID=622671 RepID=A0A562RS54_9BACT|nr:ParM/StbA family protein [Desulfobotulus alkaliphilus]TWI71763.1 plasmid segregation protein ParM [Desulfobotulus alkaliphilus]